MGKRIVIKNANFAADAIEPVVSTLRITSLYDKAGNVVSSIYDTISEGNYINAQTGQLASLSDVAITELVEIPSGCKGKNFAYRGSSFKVAMSVICAMVAFYDSNETLISAYVCRNTSGKPEDVTSKYLGVYDAPQTDISGVIPNNASYVRCACCCGSRKITSAAEFYFETVD